LRTSEIRLKEITCLYNVSNLIQTTGNIDQFLERSAQEIPLTTGIGIRADRASALFSPFVQADASTTRKYGGTGLGLAISKQLVEMMGGKIGTESREGEGSTFWFTSVFETLPGLSLAPTAEPLSASPQEPASEPAIEPFLLSCGIRRESRILIVEDNPTNRAVALAQLDRLGYQADAATDGAQAVDALERGNYDLVLMDCQMPVMDGFEATRLIRQSNHPELPIIALTADAMSGDQEKCIREGMNDYLSKPVELRQLAEVLAKWLSRPAPRAALPPVESPASKPALAVFDSEALLQRLMGDRQLAGIVIRGFVDDFPAWLKNLRQHFEEANGPGICLQAHALKGSAATVSANSLSAVARDMERAATAGELDHCSELLPRTAEEFERFKTSLGHTGWL
jgi:CheY-like chemotaxis protein/HPt (histidine-containing phosphotransfer) domain-containing protein